MPEQLTLEQKLILLKNGLPEGVFSLLGSYFLAIDLTGSTISKRDIAHTVALAHQLGLICISSEEELSFQERPKAKDVILGKPKAGTFEWD